MSKTVIHILVVEICETFEEGKENMLNVVQMRMGEISKKSAGKWVLLLLMISVTHSTCGVLYTVSWRGVRGCLNNFSGCYCKI